MMSNSNIEKVILDTDIGTDIDDAISLAYLLMQPRCELLGITTVTGEVEKRAKLASVMCKAANKDIPIFPGCESPLLVSQKEKYAPQAEILDKWEHDKTFPKGEAIEFMRKTIRKYPGEITLLGIAPLTNIALLFTVDPEIPRLLKRLVLMCGKFSDFHQKPSGNIDRAFVPNHTNQITCNGALEMNALIDPHATSIVYNAPVKIHRSVGIDITHRVTMTLEEFKRAFKHDMHRPIIDMSSLWFKEREVVTFHDPLATVSIFDDSICTFKRGNVNIELKSDQLKGYTFWTDDPNGKHEVADDVNIENFFNHYFSVFS